MVADNIKTELRQCGGIDPLIDCLESDSQEIRRYALRTLCNLSFDGKSPSAVRG